MFSSLNTNLLVLTLDCIVQVAAVMHTFFMAMVLHPDIQARARRELENVLGSHRLPTFEDYGSVPYIDAVIKEMLRWHPIVPLGKPLAEVESATTYTDAGVVGA